MEMTWPKLYSIPSHLVHAITGKASPMHIFRFPTPTLLDIKAETVNHLYCSSKYVEGRAVSSDQKLSQTADSLTLCVFARFL